MGGGRDVAKLRRMAQALKVEDVTEGKLKEKAQIGFLIFSVS
jgi:hypothetical protein